MRRRWHAPAALVPIGFNALLCLYLTLWVALRARGGTPVSGVLGGAWLACAVVSVGAWLLHRWLARAARPVLSLVPPILAFLVFGSLCVGALATLAQP